MADLTFNTVSGKTIDRELVIAFLNTGTAQNPTWSPLGRRVEDSSAAIDWGDESIRDILGATWGSLKKPVITQTFDPSDLDAGDAAIVKIWNLAIKDQDYGALATQDMLIVHFYAGSASAPFAERYSACMIAPSGLGGSGGGNIQMPLNVTYGGTRTVGTATKDATTGVVTFIADESSGASIGLNTHSVTITNGGTYLLTATVVPAGTSVTWNAASSSVATVSSGGLVTAAGVGNTIVTASITVSGVTYSDTCTVIVESAG